MKESDSNRVLKRIDLHNPTHKCKMKKCRPLQRASQDDCSYVPFLGLLLTGRQFARVFYTSMIVHKINH